MDLDDFEDAPSEAPTRFSRFAPKFSKLKPRPKAIDKVEPNMESIDSKATVEMEDTIISDMKEEVNVEDPMEEDESEDTVVREIDVFFSPQTDANSQLYVLQYPLRPCWRPYELDERCEEVRVNSKSSEMEIDLAIDFESKNYDQTTGSRTNMTKQTLASSWKPPNTSGYAVGILMGNNLHLNPVHTIVQLRPSFEHLNSDGLKKDATDVDPDVKLEKPNTENSVDSLRKMNKQIERSSGVKTDDGELWISLKYHGSKSTLSTTYLQRMVAQETSPINFTMDPYDYLNSLCPGISSGNGEKSRGPSRRVLLSLPLEERIQRLLTEGPPVQKFNVLKHFAPDYGPEEFVEALQQHALLVQGLWIPKSSLVYPGENDQCLARDFTLLLFSKNPVINASQINIHKRYRDKVKQFLKLLAVERSSFKDWKFKEHTDVSFIKNYPDVVQKQEKIWEAKEQNIKKFIPDIAKSGSSTTATTSNPNVTINNSGSVTKIISVGVKGKNTMSVDTREALPKALQKVFQNHKVCSFQLICQGLRDLAVAQSTLPKADARYAVAAAYGVDAPPDELKRIIKQVATEVHGLYVLTSSQEHPEYDQLRKVVIDLLRGKGPSAILKRADVAEAAKTVLGRDMINNEYTKVMNELCISKGSAWVLKSGDGNSK